MSHRCKREGHLTRHLRHRWEWPMWALTVAPVVVWLLVASTATVGWLLAGLAASWAWIYLQLRMDHARLLAQGVRTSPTQLPVLHATLARCAARLPLPAPVDLVVVQSPVLQAFTFGLRRTNTIVVTSALVAALEDDEVAAVVAHEWGHLALGHTVLGSLVGALTQASVVRRPMRPMAHPPARALRPASAIPSLLRVGLGVTVTLLVPLLLLAHRRLAEFSADRAAVWVMEDPAPLVRALAKLAVGPALAAALDEAGLVAQAERLSRTPFGFLHALQIGHPFIGTRLQAARRWHASPTFRALAAGALHPAPGSAAPATETGLVPLDS